MTTKPYTSRDQRCSEHCAGRIVQFGDSAMFMCGPCRMSVAVWTQAELDAADRRAAETSRNIPWE